MAHKLFNGHTFIEFHDKNASCCHELVAMIRVSLEHMILSKNENKIAMIPKCSKVLAYYRFHEQELVVTAEDLEHLTMRHQYQLIELFIKENVVLSASEKKMFQFTG